MPPGHWLWEERIISFPVHIGQYRMQLWSILFWEVAKCKTLIPEPGYRIPWRRSRITAFKNLISYYPGIRKTYRDTCPDRYGQWDKYIRLSWCKLSVFHCFGRGIQHYFVNNQACYDQTPGGASLQHIFNDVDKLFENIFFQQKNNYLIN